MNIQEVDPQKLIEETATLLKGNEAMKPPAWATFAKTGVSKERAPVDPDWWYTRAASILRKTMLLGPVGTSKLRRVYGAKKNRGVKKERFYKGSGSIVRKVLQQFEKAGLVSQVQKSNHKGRSLTPEGVKLLAAAAKKVR